MRHLRSLILVAALALSATPAMAQYSGARLITNLPSGVAPVKCSLTATGTCGPLTVAAGRDFNVEISNTFVGATQLERLLPGETVWKPITAAGTQMYVWTAPASESAGEAEYGVQYRVRVTSYTSGQIDIRLSQ